MGGHSLLVWGGFSALVLGLLAVDLLVVNRKSHVLAIKEAALWSGGLALLALGFGLFLLWYEGTPKALEFYSGYLIELSLSIDNLFVFLLIFQYFKVPEKLQPRVLKWGIFGAMIMRGFMIAVGAYLLMKFHWITYVFGAILVIAGARMLKSGGLEPVKPEHNPVVKLARKILPFTAEYDKDHFFTKMHGKWFGTPLLLVVLIVEWSDLVFAIDSIPAVFAVTRDPFIVYSSNVFAILGLRALYFVLAGVMDKFRYLKPAVAGILIFVGLKMGLSAWIHVSTGVSLAVILGLLTAGIAASVLHPAAPKEERTGGRGDPSR
jgi:tellurite resistance protein TerC